MSDNLKSWILNKIPTILPGGSRLKEKLTKIIGCEGLNWTTLQNGMKMYVNLDRVSERHLWLGCYPYNIHDFLYKNLQRDSVFIDCGANIGIWSIIALSYYRRKSGTVYSIEPNPKLIERLEKQKEMNKVEDIWKIIPTAVSDQETELNLIINEVHEKSFIGKAKEDLVSNTISVESVKLDDLNFKRKIVGIKIDVEGHEPQVIKGAINIIKKHKPWIYTEINVNYTKTKILEKCPTHNLLSELGYTTNNSKGKIITETCEDFVYYYNG